MKRVVIAVAAVLSLVLALPAFAIEGIQLPKETGINFEQMKADYLKKLDERVNSLQQEKTCVQAAKNRDDVKTCRSQHKAKMKDRRDDMRMRGGSDRPAGQVPPQVK